MQFITPTVKCWKIDIAMMLHGKFDRTNVRSVVYIALMKSQLEMIDTFFAQFENIVEIKEIKICEF